MVRDYTIEEQKRIAKNQAEIDALEAQRIDALNSRDAKKYSDLCDRLGVEPELPELIELARADEIHDSAKLESLVGLKKPSKPRKNAADPAKYRAFLDEAEGCNYDDFAAQSNYKREVLKRHFGGRYKVQDMVSYDSTKLGAVFRKIIDTAREVVSRE